MNARPRPSTRCPLIGLLGVVSALTACKTQGTTKGHPSSAVSAAPAPTLAMPVSAAASAAAVASQASPSPSASALAVGSAAPQTKLPPVAATDPCNLLKGPIQLSVTGAATVWVGDDARPEQDPHILFNRDGVARAVTLPPSAPRADASAKAPSGKAPAPKAKGERPERLALTEAAERATAPGCALASGFLYCMAASGAIHRTTLTGEGDTVLANGRPGTPIAAATLAGQQPVLTFLADRKTSEGFVTTAFAVLGDATPVQISEDGSGATFITLAPRGDQAVAMYIDARRALTPLHARILSAETGKLRLGNDAVIFVGEGTEGRPIGAVAQAQSGPAFGLLPIFKDMTTFGVASIRIDEQPRDDAPVTWSTYPNGLDRAPIAATLGVTPVRVVLVRPASKEPKAKRVLELAEVDSAGTLKPLCTVAESSTFADLSLTADRFGTLWLVYTDADGTWIERRGKAP